MPSPTYPSTKLPWFLNYNLFKIYFCSYGGPGRLRTLLCAAGVLVKDGGAFVMWAWWARHSVPTIAGVKYPEWLQEWSEEEGAREKGKGSI